jgi:hypothetical protein
MSVKRNEIVPNPIEIPINKLQFLKNVSAKSQWTGNLTPGIFVANGTFTSNGIATASPLMMSDGITDFSSESASVKSNRGAIALVGETRKIKIGILKFELPLLDLNAYKAKYSYVSNPNYKKIIASISSVARLKLFHSIQKSFGVWKDDRLVEPVVELMGGGFMMRYQGKPINREMLINDQNAVTNLQKLYDNAVKSGDKTRANELDKLILECRSFDEKLDQQCQRGFSAGQMRDTNHTAVGEKGGRPHLIIFKNSGEGISKLSNYETLVMFDGGRGFWAHDKRGGSIKSYLPTESEVRTENTPLNPLGIAVY